jgi:hypothetical protein
MSAAVEYALLTAMPRIDRGERINVGVLLHCQQADFLAAGVAVDADRLRALDPGVDVDAVCTALDSIQRICAGVGGDSGGDTGGDSADPALSGSTGVRFGRLAAPRSTVVQPGPVHGGLTDDPAAALERLLDQLVRIAR